MPLGGNKKGGQAKPDQTKRSGVRLGETKRSEVGAITYNDTITALFNGLFMITIKDNSNAIPEAHLNYLVRYCAKFCKADVIKAEYEFGKQGRFHVHAVCRAKNGKMPNIKAFDTYLKKYTIWYETEECNTIGHKICRTAIRIDSLTFNISSIRDENHSQAVDHYLKKEQGGKYDDVEFID